MVSKLKYRKGQTVCTKKGEYPILKGMIDRHSTMLRGTKNVPTNVYRLKVIGDPFKLVWRAEHQLRKCPRKRRKN